MTHSSSIRGLILIASAVALAGCGAYGGADDTAASRNSSLLDGVEKSLVVVGYSTSYAWPQMLQEMLDEHSGGKRTYHILNAVIGGSPVGRWIAPPDSQDFQDTYGAMRNDFFGSEARLRGSAPPPTVAILQQSLQRTPTRATRLGPVTSANDARGIEIGADAMERLATQLHEDGIERVYIAMHIYKEGYEPEVGNERFALADLLRRGRDFIFEGPDVWSLTIREHPKAFTEDRLHPNESGAKIMAEAWYRALAGDDARQEIIDAMHARSYDVHAMTNDYLAWRRGS
ncbi:MAG: SGNH/GDSL hydrolase family protein [Gemmatimonadales bacterium]